MFEKMAVTLAESGKFDVSVIGYPTVRNPSFKEIEFISFPAFNRISIQRIMTRWKIFREVWKIRPLLLIITTHELLPQALILKILLNTVIVYDVQENYYRNILHSGSFPLVIRWPLAVLVRLKEKLLAPSIDHFFLAERGYEKEFKFHRGGWSVVENKAHPSSQLPFSSGRLQRTRSEKLNLLFSGTLAESTGVFWAIDMAKGLHHLDSNVTLTIIGKAALRHERERIQREINDVDFITFVGGEEPVPHSEIIQAIEKADFGIIAYPPSHHTRNSHPTKLFEYLNHQLPIILDRQWTWIERYLEYQPFAFFNFTNPDYSALLNDLKSKTFYPRTPENVTWESEKTVFLTALGKFIV